MEDGWRKIRLSGDGNFGSRGGGLPLSWAFETVLQELLDHGPLPEDGLVDKIRRGRLALKEKAVFARWGEKHGWERMARDVLDELMERKMIIGDEQRSLYALGPEFRSGVRLEVFTTMFVTVRSEQERSARDALAQMHQRLFELIALGDRVGVHDGPQGESRKSSLMAVAKLYEWDNSEYAHPVDPTVPPLESDSPAVTLAKIRPGLTGYLPAKRPKRKRGRAEIEKVLGPKPTHRELLKFYTTGPDIRRGVKVFDANAQRVCESPLVHPAETLLDVEAFEVYPSKEQGWYFQGQCHDCRLESMRRQRAGRNASMVRAELAERLRHKPGETVIVQEFAREKQMEAMKLARNIRSGKLKEFGPPGSFGAVTDVHGSTVVVEAFFNP